MKLALKIKWIEALLSGQYLQGRAQLKSAELLGQPPKYCCLGVLREVMDPKDERGVPAAGSTGAGDPFYLMTDQLQEAGLSDGMQKQLAELNDNPASPEFTVLQLSKGFPGVAQYIDRYIPGEL